MIARMTTLPQQLYTAAQVRELDRRAIEEQGIAGIELMERAGRAACDFLRRRWPRARRIALFAGVGNNGGDAFILARLLHELGLQASIFQVGDARRIRGDAHTALQRAQDAGVEYQPMGPLETQRFELLVDGMLGTGLNGEVVHQWADAIDLLNTYPCPVLALDIPSGLHADNGRVLGTTVRAAATITFIGLKRGQFTGEGPESCGELVFDDLSVPPAVYEDLSPSAQLLDARNLARIFAPRSRSSHKGDFGHVLLIGGDRGMGGAIRLAAEAALRVGAGRVSVACRPEHIPAITAARPEIMVHGVEQAIELGPLLEKARVVVLGPGLGQSDWSRSLFVRALQYKEPMVLDADGLNLLADDPFHHDTWVLTPHPGEAARLLGQDNAQVQADRFISAAEIEASYGGVCVLKGAGTLVQAPYSTPGVCALGNPGMASAGMGDVLSGVIGGLMAQGMEAAEAAERGVCLHALAADHAAAEGGERGLLAGDLFVHLRRLVNGGGSHE